MMSEIEIGTLREYMREGQIKFKYQKVNGEIREAIGTLNMEYIDEQGAKPTSNSSKPNVFTYFDIEKNQWRSCRENNILEYTEPDAINLNLFK